MGSQAQNVNLRGVVSGGDGKAVANASVTLVGLNLKATTDASGNYSITRTTSILSSIRSDDFAMINGILELTLRGTVPASVEVFDIGGHLLRRELLPTPVSGIYRWDIAQSARGTGLLVIKASIGNQSQSFRFLPLGQGRGSAASSSFVGGGLARAAVLPDTVKVTASGFKDKAVAITSYEQTLNIALEANASTGAGRSAGCGKALGSLKTGYYKITSSGISREYAIDIPTNYDPSKAYKLYYCSHWIGSKAADIVNGVVSNGGAANWAFYGLKRMADSAQQPGIFIAPSANGSTWGQSDHALFDDILKYAKTNLCIDTARVFATGFSFGAMITYSLSTNHQTDIRAVATLAAANYNIWLPTNSHKKIAYLGITGMSDGTCPFINSESAKTGGFFAALGHAQDNGCTVPTTVTKANPGISTTSVGSKKHVVYDFPNCSSGYPVKYITFDGAHIAAPTDGQTSDDGNKTWAPREVWKFFSQF